MGLVISPDILSRNAMIPSLRQCATYAFIAAKPQTLPEHLKAGRPLSSRDTGNQISQAALCTWCLASEETTIK
jgi:hypothetical protein